MADTTSVSKDMPVEPTAYTPIGSKEMTDFTLVLTCLRPLYKTELAYTFLRLRLSLGLLVTADFVQKLLVLVL